MNPFQLPKGVAWEAAAVHQHRQANLPLLLIQWDQGELQIGDGLGILMMDILGSLTVPNLVRVNMLIP